MEDMNHPDPVVIFTDNGDDTIRLQPASTSDATPTWWLDTHPPAAVFLSGPADATKLIEGLAAYFHLDVTVTPSRTEEVTWWEALRDCRYPVTDSPDVGPYTGTYVKDDGVRMIVAKFLGGDAAKEVEPDMLDQTVTVLRREHEFECAPTTPDLAS